ncbi:C-type lectin domain family 17, member A [Gracilinanus agilis]|uniref:C-type lectin domain family 17, member A n=1 Tax=Gracilinanus agilis TaxID=191870 RepID=UPI001CFECD6A|nr:C-type lectin domain family 17, member A [Gracilinanus agilis]
MSFTRVAQGPEDDDYENMASSREDLPPKPGTRKFPSPGGRLGWLRGSIAPPRPPRAGKKAVKPALPSKSSQAAGLGLAIVSSSIPSQTNLHLNSPACQPLEMADLGLPPIQGFQSSQLLQTSQVFHSGQGFQVPQPSQGFQFTQAPEPSQKRKIFQLTRKEKMAVCLCMLVGIALLLSVTNLAVTLMKLTEPRGLAALRKDIYQIQEDTNRTITELRDLIGCARKSCPRNWLPFEGSCYFFSTTTKSWDAANLFCMENYSHLVIINDSEEQNFVSKARRSIRTYWLGLTDRKVEGEWKWLDDSLLTSSFWKIGEPNDSFNEDCVIMLSSGLWNDISCTLPTYWICEMKYTC